MPKIKGRHYPNTSKENWWRNCEQCGNKFHVPPSDIKMGWGKCCSVACAALWRKGKPVKWNKNSAPGKGEKHHNWKGGSYKQRMDEKSVTWARSVKERDDFTCQLCSKKGGNLNSHHLFFWSSYPDMRWDLNNGITLCVECHRHVHSICKDYVQDKTI